MSPAESSVSQSRWNIFRKRGIRRMTTGSPLYEILEKLPHPESDFGWIAWMPYGHMAGIHKCLASQRAELASECNIETNMQRLLRAQKILRMKYLPPGFQGGSKTPIHQQKSWRRLVEPP